MPSAPAPRAELTGGVPPSALATTVPQPCGTRVRAEAAEQAASIASRMNQAIIPEPFPHIAEKKNLAVMPETLVPLWQQFIHGQGVLIMDRGGLGIYPWDFPRFLHVENFRRLPCLVTGVATQE